MTIGRPLAPLTLSPSEREELLSITRSRSMPQSLATRARIVLLAADGETNTDAFFVEKVRDIVGLYLNPPDHAVVLCVDEKSQIQALDRTQPTLPIGLGYVEGVTHGSVRHGTTTLFAALDIATGRVITRCKKQHRHQELLGFLRQIDASVPKKLDVHLVVAEPGRDLFQHLHPAGNPTRHVPKRPGSDSEHRNLRGPLQPQVRAVRVARNGRLDPREAGTTE